MVKSREIVIFLAGAQFFHTISHILLPFFITLPMDLRFMILTPMINIWIVSINAVITALLLWWASRFN